MIAMKVEGVTRLLLENLLLIRTGYEWSMSTFTTKKDRTKDDQEEIVAGKVVK